MAGVAAMTNLLYSDTEVSLRDVVREVAGDLCPPELALSAYQSPPGPTESLWRALSSDLGLAGLLVPEDLGGAGASVREAAAASEELGYAAAPVPFLTSSVLATTALLDAGATQTVELLAGGAAVGALAIPAATMPRTWSTTVRRTADGLQGSVAGVAGVTTDGVLVVPVDHDGAIELHVTCARPGMVRPVVSLDMTRPLTDLVFEGCPSTPVGSGGESVERALLAACGVLASEQLGVARWCLEASTRHLNSRVQFGRPLGSFQAIKHRLADLWSQVSLANAAARYAADCVASGDPDSALAVSLARAYCSDVAVLAAEEAIQLHGGTGMTWEYPAHVYLKRAKASQLTFGTADQHRSRVAEIVALGL